MLIMSCLKNVKYALRGKMKQIYMDNAAATQLDNAVKQEMQLYEEVYFNPSSFHDLGSSARKILESSRQTFAQIINCDSSEIIFASGGTESINLAIKGASFA